jgi:ubiquitin carboxyl-terminal hydrolase 2
MNTILQSLSNTKYLLEYCLRNKYSEDINTTMSVMKGSLFKSYATLIKLMWKSDKYSVINPQDFKSQIARFAPRFVGYSQQDSEGDLSFSLITTKIIIIHLIFDFLHRISLLSTKGTP